MGMEEITKKINKFMAISMGITISVILSTYGVLMSGHFSIVTLLLSYLISITVALLIGLFIPLRSLVEVLTKNITGIWEAIIDNFVMNIIYVLVISSLNLFVMTSLANMGITKQIDGINNDIVTIEEQISALNLSEEEMKLDSANSEYKELETQRLKLSNKVSAMDANRPNFIKTWPKTILSSFIISFILGFVFRSIYLNIALKKYGIKI